MKSRQLIVASLALIGLLCATQARAQLAGEIYTWTHAYGDAAGANNEGWSFNFGGNSVVLDNTTDGVLTLTESSQLDWAIIDSFNRIRESSNPNDFGGLDLTGLDSIEIDIEHNGLQTYGGQIFAQTPNGPNNCCDFDVLGGFSIAPGVQTISVPLSGLTADKKAWVRTIGVQMFDHTWDTMGSPLTWKIHEVRSVGPGLYERFLSPHETAGDLDGAVVKFDETAISGGVVDGQPGLSIVANDAAGQALRWVDLGGGPGAAIAWGNGRDGVLAVDYHTRPTDLRNYGLVDVRMRAQPGAGADPSVGVQFYVQAATPGNAFLYQAAGDLTLPADGQYHVLTFPLSALINKGEIQWHGINLHGHVGNMDIRVDYVRFYVPEPATAAMLLAGAIGGVLISARKGR